MAKPEHRTLRFESFDEAMQEAETLAAGTHHATGNFSLGQILEHLARTLEIASGNRLWQPRRTSIDLDHADVLSHHSPHGSAKSSDGIQAPRAGSNCALAKRRSLGERRHRTTS